MKRKRQTPEQAVRKLREGEKHLNAQATSPLSARS